jgi:hypothetical protein
MPLDPYQVRVRTLDLLQSCPIWVSQYARLYDHPPMRATFEMRRRWSDRVVCVTAPVGIGQVPGADMDLITQKLSYWKCRSQSFWKAVGPPALMEDLAKIQAAVWGRYGTVLYLCQHEIRGD